MMPGPETAADGGCPMIRVRGLCKSFGANRVLDGLDLDVLRGESLAVIGGSGTGSCRS